MAESASRTLQDQPRAAKKPWQLASVRIALIVTLLGLGLWVYSAISAARKPVSADTTGTDPSLVSGFGATSSESPSSQPVKDRKLISAAAPATFRFGLSFLAGFALAWAMKRFIKLSLLIGGLLIAGIYFLRRNGMIELPWDQIEDQVEGGMSWLQGQTDSIKDVVTGYLPSGVATLGGLFVGFRKG